MKMNEQEAFYIKTYPKKYDSTWIIGQYIQNSANFDKYLHDISEDKYLYWDKAQYKTPIEGYSSDESWQIARMARRIKSVPTPIMTERGEFFKWYRLEKTDKILRSFDMKAGGNIFSSMPGLSKENHDRFLIKGIMEESISSSELEGADTSSKYAKKMLSENIKPRNDSERMILNHYKTLQKINSEYKDQELSRSLLLEMQATLTEGIETEKDYSGRFREDEDEIIVQYKGKIAHIPPKNNFMLSQVDALVEYANNDDDFVHPLVKAIVLHFWIGYLHPFCDGNGRTARSIFYWYLLKHKYWAILYLPISSTIKKSKDQYAMSYIYSEQDDNDFTYFYSFMMKKVMQTIDEFDKYIERKIYENRLIASKVKKYDLNPRQSQALLLLIKNKDDRITGTAHAQMNNIGVVTAYKDLKDMEKKGLVFSTKVGQKNYYSAKSELDI